MALVLAFIILGIVAVAVIIMGVLVPSIGVTLLIIGGTLALLWAITEVMDWYEGYGKYRGRGRRR